MPTVSASTVRRLMPFAPAAAWIAAMLPAPTRTVNVSKIRVGADFEAEFLQARRERARQPVNAPRDGLQALRPVVDGVHRRDDRQEHLRRADVARRLVAADVLLARLEAQAVGGFAVLILGNADQPAGHHALELVLHREVRRVRPAVAQRHAEALRAAHGHVRAEFAGRLSKHSASGSAATTASAPAAWTFSAKPA